MGKTRDMNKEMKIIFSVTNLQQEDSLYRCRQTFMKRKGHRIRNNLLIHPPEFMQMDSSTFWTKPNYC